MKKLQSKIGVGILMLFMLLIGTTNKTYAHCEIPCGIYADSVRVVLLSEHITTIEKSMKKITELSAADQVDYNQLVRWVTNKEDHAKKIQEIATQYFMFQRVKVSDDPEVVKKNTKLLAVLHEICVYAMKTKQTTDLQYIKKLNDTVHNFSHLYFGKKGHHHHH
ncbi:superoxide dismutase, Ni [Labilibaculum sp. DW002]|uniref:Superoxide dismutase, Ni n=1 Tax=Paralabilibaculum antarcticum TaxID=2912572 RepID=A0ABT5VMC5_9BACT|nr:superoxide dismutase [Ni] [Labilibaculum sp. DW002]MDE5416432.1 superoxide dismutase, Ni [Labilibaculum sp. DW002]